MWAKTAETVELDDQQQRSATLRWLLLPLALRARAGHPGRYCRPSDGDARIVGVVRTTLLSAQRRADLLILPSPGGAS